MNPHALTIEFAIRSAEQPAVSMPGNDPSALEQQIHGFDFALAATDQLGACQRFNRVFSRFLASKVEHAGTYSWSAILLGQYGATPAAIDRLRIELLLFKKAQTRAAAVKQSEAATQRPGHRT